ncbi:MAG: NAD(P)H-dependent oxidoreductase subunit E [Anaerolineales bacterium]|nr:NAD(P)H-dependent oxidoreductase subunit E [Anaerolineales bacterium]MCS7247341.1 NAD(P)H-dependent oxidoreductase subunit E [Anaerolineales bacterium]MDW8161152.1 NAD(P)H-dependent oxidoreductase subunit E [Anaerolineales bacterium]MDW8446424.1 NAD(P)H-dependent oxidoreductase subunit E [Anaerolineales bacterium]
MEALLTNPSGAKVTSIRDARKRAMLLAALYIAQEQFGWLSEEAICRVAERLDLTVGQVKSTASFYTLFKLQPQGRYRIQVCEGLSCYLVGGAEPIIDYIAQKLGIQPGQTTADGKFTLEVVQCLAACGTAPVVRVNDDLYENMSYEAIDKLLDRLRSEDRG